MNDTSHLREPLRPCPVCLGTRVEPIHRQRFTLPEGHLLGDGYDVVHCVACGFVYADTAIKQADYDRFYAEASKYESGLAVGSGVSAHDRIRLDETAACIAQAVPSRDARILDFGCGGGGLLGSLQQIGYHDLLGVDPSPGCAEQVRATFDVAAVAGTLFAVPEDLGQFDCILLTHVLEHVEDVRGALANLLTLLKDGGLLYLEVPDAARYAEFILAPFQDFNTEHINHFSARALDNACGSVGLTAVSQGGKVLEPQPRMPAPATFGFWRKDAGVASRPPVFDAGLKPRIEDYIRRSRTIMDGYDARIRALLARSPQLVVWGTGQLTLKLLNETALGSARIVAFVDGNPVNHGKMLQGVPILAPDQITGSNDPILVASTIHFPAILDTIRSKMGNTVEVVSLD